MSRIQILTWNIQAGRGVDGRVDFARIAAVIVENGIPDVVCLQEVAHNMAGLTEGRDIDEPTEIAGLFPDHEPVFRPAIDVALPDGGKRCRFGCMILSRVPVIRVLNHLLPRPIGSEPRSMQRQALEVAVASELGVIRITTTHLEFNSPLHRMAQVARLRSLHQEAHRPLAGCVATGGGRTPYEETPPAVDSIVCGDFNFLPDSDAFQAMVEPFADRTPALADAWRTCKPGLAHPATCGVADHRQWPEGPHCRDFFFVTPGLSAAIRDVVVDGITTASDHQPVRLMLER